MDVAARMAMLFKKLLAIVVMFALTAVPEAAFGQSSSGSMAELTTKSVGIDRGERAPEFKLTSIDGRELAFDNGNPKIIFFMASWCMTCIPEERALKRIHEKYGDRVDIISVDVDIRNDTVSDLRRFQQRFGGNWPHVLDLNVAILLRVRSLDATIILNRHNVITYRDMWPTDFETLEGEVLKVLPVSKS